MPKMINFFPRQMLMGTPTASGTYYSDIFDASDAQAVNAELRVYTASGGVLVCTATVEQSDDPAFPTTSWSGYGSSLTQTGGGTTSLTGFTTTPVPKRFLRGKLEVSAQTYAVVHFNARTFCG